jgi:hypothetical protein
MISNEIEENAEITEKKTEEQPKPRLTTKEQLIANVKKKKK